MSDMESKLLVAEVNAIAIRVQILQMSFNNGDAVTSADVDSFNCFGKFGCIKTQAQHNQTYVYDFRFYCVDESSIAFSAHGSNMTYNGIYNLPSFRTKRIRIVSVLSNFVFISLSQSLSHCLDFI